MPPELTMLSQEGDGDAGDHCVTISRWHLLCVSPAHSAFPAPSELTLSHTAQGDEKTETQRRK